MECLPNRLTPFNFKIYYKEGNYLEVKTIPVKYITPFYSNIYKWVPFMVCVTDLINRIVQVLKRDLYWVRISAQEAGLMELVKL